MRTLRAFLIRLAGFAFRKRWERELSEELESNLELHIADNLLAGMSPDEARRAAVIKFGGLEPARERYRDRRSLPFLDHLVQDLRQAMRGFGRNPLFSAVIILSLGLAIGANTAIFSVIDALLLRDLPVREPDRLVTVSQTGTPRGPKEISNISYGLFRQLESERRALDGVFTFHGKPRSNVIIDAQGEVTDMLVASHSYFAVLGVQPFLGRGFAPGDENVAVISHRYWQRRLGAARDIVGRTITIDRAPYTIIGVTPPEFFGVIVGTWTDVTIPATGLTDENSKLAWVMARLGSGVTEQQARDALTAHARSWGDPRGRSEAAIALEPASRGLSFLRARFSRPLQVLMATVVLVLLIACANIAGLLLARASARRHEIAVRAGLGAGRPRLVRQLLTESMLLALAGGLLGIALAVSLRSLAPALMSTLKDPVGIDLGLNARVLMFTLLLSTLTGIVFGVLPALQSTRGDLVTSLKDTSRATGASQARLRHALVVVQIALALLLVSGASLFTRSLGNLRNIDTGFRRDSVLLLSLEPNAIGYKDQQVLHLFEQILDRVEQIPGVRSATVLRHNLLANGHGNTTIVVPGRVPKSEDRLELEPGFAFESGARLFSVGPRFVETLGMTLVEGRDLTRADRQGTRRVAIVNETFARHYFPDQSPLGRRFGHSPDAVDIEIVGVIKDVRHVRLREQPVRSVYAACLQDPQCWRDTTLQVRTDVDSMSLAPSLRAALAQVAPGLPVYNITSVRHMFDTALATESTLAAVSGFFGAVALLLACIGLYGLLAWSVERRRREIGIRMALGANASGVVTMILRETGVLVLAGIALGLPATYAAGRWIATFLYDLKPTDPLTLSATITALLLVATVSALLPARRAASIDPMTSLRQE
jgi:predicted permease